MMDVTLYHYWRSSSSWRVRWALEHKKFKAKLIHIDLLSGETESPEHLQRHPLGYVPVLLAGGRNLVESVAIIEWLEELVPKPALYPGDSFQRAHIRSLVEVINADTQPIQNLNVLDKYSSEADKRKEWMQYFIRRGLSAYETLTKPSFGKFSVGDQITAADLFLIPQCYNGLRNDVSLEEFPCVFQIYENALKLPDVRSSHPEKHKP